MCDLTFVNWFHRLGRVATKEKCMNRPSVPFCCVMALCVSLIAALFARPAPVHAVDARDAGVAPLAAEDSNETRLGTLQAQKIEFDPPSLVIDDKDYEISEDFDSSLTSVVSWLIQSKSRGVSVAYVLDSEGRIVSIQKTSTLSSSRVTVARSKRASTPAGRSTSAAAAEMKRLASKSTVGLDATLGYYFTSTQIAEMRDFLQVWTALIVSTQNVDSPDLGERVIKKVFNKLGISVDTFLFKKDTNGSVSIKAESINGEDATVEFDIHIGSYTLDKEQSPFGSLGEISYEVKGCPSIKGHPTRGEGIVTFADMETFCDQVASIANSAIKGAYNDVWGNSANKVAELFVSAPINALLKGKYSDNVYELLSAPTENYLKEARIKCPVDVYVYDSSGDLCGSVENNVVTNDEGVLIYVVGDEKRVFLGGDDYILKLVGTAPGTMEYEVVEYADDSEVRSVVTRSLPLSGKTYYGIIPSAIYCDNGVYPLSDEQGKEIPLDGDTVQSLDEDDPFDSVLSGQCGDDVEWIYYDGVLALHGSGEMYEPEEGHSLTPQSWGWHAQRSSITRLYVGGGITSIGDNALAGCANLTQVELAPSVSRIGYRAFDGCAGLTAFSLPESGCELDAYVFSDCTGLRELVVPAGTRPTDEVASAVGGAYYKGALVRVASFGPFAESSIEKMTVESAETIPDALFQGCQSVRSIALPGGLKTIGEYAFAGCRSLEEIIIPDGVSRIGLDAFYFCDGLRRIVVPASVVEVDDPFATYGSSVADGDIPPYREDLIIQGYENSYFYVWMHYMNGKNPGLIEVPGTFVSVGEVTPFTFAQGTYSSNVTWSLDSSLTLYVSGHGEMADAERVHSGITSRNYPWGDYRHVARFLVLGEGLTSIGEGAFSEFDLLESVTLPRSLRIVGNNAFYECSSLKVVDVQEGTVAIENLAFASCPSLASVTVPKSVTKIGFKAFDGCENLANVYYEGDRASWAAIDLEGGNENLTSGKISFASEESSGSDPDPRPDSGKNPDSSSDSTTVPSDDQTPDHDVKSVAMHRLYNQWTGEHLYTSNGGEKDVLVGLGWTYEGIGWNAPTEGKEVYRLYNPYVAGGDHHYTMDVNEYDQLEKLGWSKEGVGWYSAGTDGVPLYRQYNPYATTSTHNYTADKHENDVLVSLGWRAEGIAWYGLRL